MHDNRYQLKVIKSYASMHQDCNHALALTHHRLLICCDNRTVSTCVVQMLVCCANPQCAICQDTVSLNWIQMRSVITEYMQCFGAVTIVSPHTFKSHQSVWRHISSRRIHKWSGYCVGSFEMFLGTSSLIRRAPMILHEDVVSHYHVCSVNTHVWIILPWNSDMDNVLKSGPMHLFVCERFACWFIYVEIWYTIWPMDNVALYKFWYFPCKWFDPKFGVCLVCDLLPWYCMNLYASTKRPFPILYSAFYVQQRWYWTSNHKVISSACAGMIEKCLWYELCAHAGLRVSRSICQDFWSTEDPGTPCRL